MALVGTDNLLKRFSRYLRLERGLHFSAELHLSLIMHHRTRVAIRSKKGLTSGTKKQMANVPAIILFICLS